MPGTPAGQFLTGDQNLVNVQLVLHYAIGETDEDLDDYVMHQDQVDAVLGPRRGGRGGRVGRGPAGRSGAAHRQRGAAGVGDGPRRRTAAGVPARRAGAARERGLPRAAGGGAGRVRGGHAGADRHPHARNSRPDRRRASASGRPKSLRYRLEQEAARVSASRNSGRRAPTPTEFRAQLGAYRDVAKTNPDALAFLWWDEMRKALAGLKARGGRVEPLDAYLGAAGWT